jgi:hypothetical protein
MPDGEWAGGRKLPLFQWELRDDLSAMMSLPRLYIIPKENNIIHATLSLVRDKDQQ